MFFMLCDGAVGLSNEAVEGFIKNTNGAVFPAQLGNPRGSYDEHSSKSSLSMKLRFIEPVGERTNF
jgi:hypothetical protein